MRTSTCFFLVRLLALGVLVAVCAAEGWGRPTEPPQDPFAQPGAPSPERGRFRWFPKGPPEFVERRPHEGHRETERHQERAGLLRPVVLLACVGGAVACGQLFLSRFRQKPLTVRLAAVLLIVGAWVGAGLAFLVCV
ncbi:MAG TPA: hypothetical protein VNK04_24680 [Gemmataceae bacterium]|nr:hypothetical protein [Gemmataceae bacterium]